MAGVELTIVAETNAMSIQKNLVLGGHGLTILPPIACATELASRQLTAAPLADPKISRTIAVALPANRSVGQHVQRVVELLVECARDAVRRKDWLEASWIAK
jgi:DNA-binding transcriptional LysR family regulator